VKVQAVDSFRESTEISFGRDSEQGIGGTPIVNGEHTSDRSNAPDASQPFFDRTTQSY
jgi:hypothetical protein